MGNSSALFHVRQSLNFIKHLLWIFAIQRFAHSTLFSLWLVPLIWSKEKLLHFVDERSRRENSLRNKTKLEATTRLQYVKIGHFIFSQIHVKENIFFLIENTLTINRLIMSCYKSWIYNFNQKDCSIMILYHNSSIIWIECTKQLSYPESIYHFLKQSDH